MVDQAFACHHLPLFRNVATRAQSAPRGDDQDGIFLRLIHHARVIKLRVDLHNGEKLHKKCANDDFRLIFRAEC
jgi:hypothetical protein